MTPLERVTATLMGRPVDRRPATATLSLYGARLTECPLDRYYTEPEAYARGQQAVFETFEPDILLSPFLAAGVAEAFGGTIRRFETSPPTMARPALARAEEVASLELPAVDRDPGLRYLAESVRGMRRLLGEDVPIAAALLGPADVCPLLMGIEAWIEALVFEPETARSVLDRIVPFAADLANALVDAEATFVAWTGALTVPRTVSAEIARSLTLPAFAAGAQRVRAPIVFHHGGAPLGGAAGIIAEGLPQVRGFAVDPRDDLGAVRQAIGPERLLLGNVDGPTLGMRSAEDTAARCRRILDDRGEDPCFILATSGADIPYDTPPANVRALLSASRVGRGGTP